MSQDQFHLKDLLALILKESKTLVQKCKVPAESKLLYIILRIKGFQSKKIGRVFVKMSLFLPLIAATVFFILDIGLTVIHCSIKVDREKNTDTEDLELEGLSFEPELWA